MMTTDQPVHSLMPSRTSHRATTRMSTILGIPTRRSLQWSWMKSTRTLRICCNVARESHWQLLRQPLMVCLLRKVCTHICVNEREHGWWSFFHFVSSWVVSSSVQSINPSLTSLLSSPIYSIGFGKPSSSLQQQQRNKKSSSSPYVGIGPPDTPPRRINDVTKPEYDDQGYTLYQNEETGEKKRVFEALVDYPCRFTMKIVGAKEGAFVEEMVDLVAETCHVTADQVSYSTKEMGKWTSVTVEAPVESAEMLYGLYENVDRDPRVKFKF